MTEQTILRAPFPWFGGKSRVAGLVWDRFGDARNFVEPFAGSLAVLLGRPHAPRVETVNDRDYYLANFWRSLAGDKADPEKVAYYADAPVNEADLHARHLWLVHEASKLLAKIPEDPDFFDAKVAGWWVWGQCLWIGSGWCMKPEWKGRANAGRNGRGIHANGTDRGRIVDWSTRPDLSAANGRGGVILAAQDDPTGNVWKKRPRATRGGTGVTSTSLQGDAPQLPHKRPGVTGNGQGVGIHKVSLAQQVPSISGESGATGRGITASAFDLKTGGIYDYMFALAERLRRVRVCCGDWKRVVTPSITTKISTTALFLDPPYHAPGTERSAVYNHDDDKIWFEVRDWALEHGDDPLFRIALCGYEAEDNHGIPDSWECLSWKAAGGYGRSERGLGNRGRERIWFSPHCLTHQQEQFDMGVEG